MKLIFINFKAFSSRQKGLSAMFLEVLFEAIEEQNSDKWRIDGMMNDLEICIKS